MAEFLTQDTTQVFERLVWEARRLEKHKHERSYRKVCFLASTEDREIAEIEKMCTSGEPFQIIVY